MNNVISSQRLLCFCHVYESLSFRDAALRIGISQSAVSRHIQSLEAELEVVLFHRGRANVAPTEAGHQLYDKSKSILDALADIRNDMDNLRGVPRGPVNLALPASFATAYLHDFVPSFTQQYPQVQLRLLEGSASHIEELLLAGKADVAIVVESKRLRAFNQEHLISDQLYIVGRQEFPDEGGGEGWPIDRIAQLPLVLPLQPYGTRRIIDRLATEKMVELHPVLEADSPHILKQMVLSEDLYTIMPGISFARERENGLLHAVPLAPSVSRRLAVATVSGRATSLAARLLAQKIRNLFRTHSEQQAPTGKAEFSTPSASQ